MKTVGIRRMVSAVVLAAIPFRALPAEAATKAEQARAAAKLIDETLQREAREGVENRRELLSPLLERESPCEAAYWQSGFIFDGKRKEWLLLDEVQQRAAKDDRLAAYRNKRGKAQETEGSQVELARWCDKNKLDDQAQAHWTKVLSLNSDHLEARSQLGYQKINGTWISRQEIANARARAGSIQASLQEWGPKLDKLLKRLESSNRQARDLARQELMAIKDPTATPAIEAVFCSQGGETGLLGIEALKNMKTAEAADALAWQAVYSPWGPVQKAAAEALKEQRKHDYVPPLLSAMRTPIQAQYELYNTPDGGFLMRRALYQDGPEQSELAVLDVARPGFKIYSTKESVGPKQLRNNPNLWNKLVRSNEEDLQRHQAKLAVARVKIKAQARQEQAAIVAQNTSVANVNAQLCSVLALATGNDQIASPDGWYDWWNGYNELTTQGDKSTKVTYQVDYQPVVTVMQTPPIRRYSCLAAGTPIWTESGSVPVEQVRVGDRVLACDGDSGEIAFKPVLKTIINRGTALFHLKTEGESLKTTGGHVFWVSGQGWIRARELKPSMRFHTLVGTVELTSVEPEGVADTYNLVVADFHTYFAGKEKILTHDNTIRKPTNCVVPGLAAHVATQSP